MYWIAAVVVLAVLVFLVFYVTRKPERISLERLISDARELSVLAADPSSQSDETEKKLIDFSAELWRFCENCADLTEGELDELEMVLDRLDSSIERRDWPRVAQIAGRDVYAFLFSVQARLEEDDDEPGPIAG